MINNLLTSLLKFIFYVFNLIVTSITLPIFYLVSSLFPDLSSYINSFNYFCTNYLFKGLAFAREVFLNVTGFPRPLFHLLVNLFLLRVSFHLLRIPIQFIINTYRNFKGSGGEMVE